MLEILKTEIINLIQGETSLSSDLKKKQSNYSYEIHSYYEILLSENNNKIAGLRKLYESSTGILKWIINIRCVSLENQGYLTFIYEDGMQIYELIRLVIRDEPSFAEKIMEEYVIASSKYLSKIADDKKKAQVLANITLYNNELISSFERFDLIDENIQKFQMLLNCKTVMEGKEYAVYFHNYCNLLRNAVEKSHNENNSDLLKKYSKEGIETFQSAIKIMNASPMNPFNDATSLIRFFDGLANNFFYFYLHYIYKAKYNFETHWIELNYNQNTSLISQLLFNFLDNADKTILNEFILNFKKRSEYINTIFKDDFSVLLLINTLIKFSLEDNLIHESAARCAKQEILFNFHTAGYIQMKMSLFYVSIFHIYIIQIYCIASNMLINRGGQYKHSIQHLLYELDEESDRCLHNLNFENCKHPVFEEELDLKDINNIKKIIDRFCMPV